MATLETIRNKAGILITVFIGLALIAFVMMDLFKPGKSSFSNDSNEIGAIDGDPILIEEFQNQYGALEEWTRLQNPNTPNDENSSNRMNNQVWEQLVRERLLTVQYKNIGIEVTDLEMANQINGKTPHQAIAQMFTDPNTGVYNQQSAVESYSRRKENPNANFFWDYLMMQIKNERYFNKYSSLLKKGLYTNSLQVKNEVDAKSKNVEFDFIAKRYSSISDSSISVSDSEIKDYYNANKSKYKQDASRSFQYITFDVVPSETDNQNTRTAVEKAKSNFENPTTIASQFINRGSDNAPYRALNLKIDDVAANLRTFALTAKIGEVYGPYFENNSYNLTKLVAIKQLADSVKARHILIPAQTPNADRVADSLLLLAKTGRDFAELARTNSQDQGSAVNGGDLGWFKEGAMVPEFNNACFENNKGDIVKVQSQFGFHIINIQDKGQPSTKYELATYTKNVVYSQDTYNQMYSQASTFASENDNLEKFEKSIKAKNMVPRSAMDVKANDYKVGVLQSSRQMVKWAFEAEKDEVSPIFELNNQIVIAVLTGEKEAGIANINDVKTQIKSELIKDKKAEKIIADLNNAAKGTQSISALAQKTLTEVQSASGINFSSFQVSGAGVEPALVALASTATPNTISKAVKGENGVYIVMVKNQAPASANSQTEKMQLTQMSQYKVDYMAVEALKAKSEITDNRIRFY